MGCKKLTYHKGGTNYFFEKKLKVVYAKRGFSGKKGLNYSTFGSLQPGRSGNSGDYRYGFNGMEKDDEVKASEGNSYTAAYWQYDPRLGRRWDVDPVIKRYESSYAAFSNNPIMYIDPEGNTDYYSKGGRWIGTDGIDNNEKRVVLSKSTKKIIKEATKNNETISMNEKVYRDIQDIPDTKMLETMDKMYKWTEKNMKEVGLVVGELEGNQVQIGTKGEGEAVDQTNAKARMSNAGAKLRYDMHTHPPKVEDNGNSLTVSDHNPSRENDDGDGDIPSRAANEKNYDYDLPSKVLGYDIKQVVNKETSKVEIKKVKTINFYDSKGSRGSMTYDTYKKRVRKINKRNNKRRGGN